MEKYSDEIMEACRQRRGLEEDDESQDNEIMTMSKSEVLNEVAMWEGLIGYGDIIKSWVEDIYNIELNN